MSEENGTTQLPARLPGAPPTTTDGGVTNAVGRPGEFETPAVRDAWKLADRLIKSRLYKGFNNPDEIFALGMVLAAADHVPYMEAVARVPIDYWIVEGRPSMKADVMVAKWQLAGGRIRFQGWSTPLENPVTGEKTIPVRLERSRTRCAAELWHPKFATEPVLFELTLEELVERGVATTKDGRTLKDNYEHHPGKMIWARLVSDAIKTLAPWLVYNMITPEEVMDLVEDERTKAWGVPKAADPLGLSASHEVRILAEAPATLPVEEVVPVPAEHAGDFTPPARRRAPAVKKSPRAAPSVPAATAELIDPPPAASDPGDGELPDLEADGSEPVHEQSVPPAVAPAIDADKHDPDDGRDDDKAANTGMSFQAFRWAVLTGTVRNAQAMREAVPAWPRCTAADFRAARATWQDLGPQIEDEGTTTERVPAVVDMLRGVGITGASLDWILPGHATRKIRKLDYRLVLEWVNALHEQTEQRKRATAAPAVTAEPRAEELPAIPPQATAEPGSRRSRLLG